MLKKGTEATTWANVTILSLCCQNYKLRNAPQEAQHFAWYSTPSHDQKDAAWTKCSNSQHCGSLFCHPQCPALAPRRSDSICQWELHKCKKKQETNLLGTLCASLISQSCGCGEQAVSWPSALKARGLDSSVLLEPLIIPQPDPPNSSWKLFI